MKDEIKKLLEKATGETDFSVEAPKEKTYGDYATNVALALAKKAGKNPVEVAKEIVAQLLHANILKNVSMEKVEVAGPGFINFYLSKEYFVERLKEVDKNFGKNQSLKNKKVIVEFTDPNILKEFHIGHLMSNAIGESISRIIEFQGAKVKKANYQGDVGLHIAKAVWGKMKNPAGSWQAGYVLGSEKYESDETAKKEIIVLNKKIFERSDKAVNKLYDEGKKWSLAYFDQMYKKLGTKFDYYFFESQVADFGKNVVQKNVGTVFEKGEKGATVFKGEKVGLHTRVFINSEGLPTYEAKELGLANIKYKKYKYDVSIIVTGNEINEYFKVLMAAMSEIFPELQKKTKHIGHGMMRLPEGKMSSRTGNIITAEMMIEQVKEKVREKAVDRKLDDGNIEQIAIGALKYSILKQTIGSDIIFDVQKSISFEGDSGPYLQYSYVRAISVLQKAAAEKIKASLKKAPAEIGQLEKMMSHFPEIVQRAGREYESHIITTYLTELAREFNNYYAHNKIVEKGGEYKVAVTQAFSVIMKNGLWLLGIKAPNKM